MNKICGKCNRPEGSVSNKMGEIRFTKLKKDGSLYAYCDYCKNYMENEIKFNKNNPERSVTHESYYKRYPVNQKSIYGLIDKDKNVVYIGESRRKPYRLYCHLNVNNGALRELDDISEFSYIILWDGTDYSKQERLLREAVLIQSLKPKYNKQWNQED